MLANRFYTASFKVVRDPVKWNIQVVMIMIDSFY